MESRRVCVRGIINHNGKLFAQKLKNSDGKAANYWCTPGGGVDLGESLHDALHREMIEETGVAPQIGRLLLVQQFASDGTSNHGESEQLEFFFEITNPQDYMSIDLDSTSHGLIEIAEYDFIDPATNNLLPSILQQPNTLAAFATPHTDVLFHDELTQ